MATFIQVGNLAANSTGYFNASSIVSIVFSANNTLQVSFNIPNGSADLVTITLSSVDNTYETHRIIADALISAANSGTAYFNFPSVLPGGRTLTFAVA